MRRGLPLHVLHYPPGTSKWNKIEHRMFCHITQNWRGRPLTDRLTIVELIGATTTKTGLKVECALDTRTYEKGIQVSDAEMEMLNITGDDFHPEWNYTINPPRPAFVAVIVRSVLTWGIPEWRGRGPARRLLLSSGADISRRTSPRSGARGSGRDGADIFIATPGAGPRLPSYCAS